ncbi:hypothetical protein HBI80_194100 [Parastagonospora nodorum]|nr:hypothetical protein HBH46_121560 [Parastagonospora nodorum]KAH4166955.1 hypothetical protein HBH43_131290 [Parastagonospora nodorum]KAH4224194.1 hypothetical protein HBI06_128940 [Parastagonospora nodorum]KAH4241335.1 hypothetical protein HBI05_095060 [Parastagonospora nodorum]KAH4604194.1 hypothetical protein HBH82_133000 [Parastagonospora nodorum]
MEYAWICINCLKTEPKESKLQVTPNSDGSRQCKKCETTRVTANGDVNHVAEVICKNELDQRQNIDSRFRAKCLTLNKVGTKNCTGCNAELPGGDLNATSIDVMAKIYLVRGDYKFGPWLCNKCGAENTAASTSCPTKDCTAVLNDRANDGPYRIVIIPDK